MPAAGPAATEDSYPEPGAHDSSAAAVECPELDMLTAVSQRQDKGRMGGAGSVLLCTTHTVTATIDHESRAVVPADKTGRGIPLVDTAEVKNSVENYENVNSKNIHDPKNLQDSDSEKSLAIPHCQSNELQNFEDES